MLVTQGTRHHTRLALALGLLLIAAGCGKKTEQQQLDALRHGVSYRGYHALSERGLVPALDSYRRSMELAGEKAPPPFTPADICIARMMLAYTALSANRQLPALAESDILQAQCPDNASQQAAGALRAVAFQRYEWPGLAQQENDKAWAQTLATDEGISMAITLQVVMIYAAIQDQRWDRALVHLDSLAITFKQPWLSQIGRVGLAFQERRYQEGLQQLKQISQDPATPAFIRDEISPYIVTIEANAGDLDSRLFMPKLVSRLLWRVLQEQGGPALANATHFAEKQLWQPAQETAVGGWRGMLAKAKQWWQEFQHADEPTDPSAPVP